MNIQDFMREFGKCLKLDAEIESFCRRNFEKSITIQVNQTVKNPLSSSVIPIIILTTYGRGTTDDGELKTRGIRLEIVIPGDDYLQQDEYGVYYVPGMELLETLIELVEKFIVRFRTISGKGIASMPQSGPEDTIDQGILKAGLTLVVQLDSDYND